MKKDLIGRFVALKFFCVFACHLLLPLLYLCIKWTCVCSFASALVVFVLYTQQQSTCIVSGFIPMYRTGNLICTPSHYQVLTVQTDLNSHSRWEHNTDRCWCSWWEKDVSAHVWGSLSYVFLFSIVLKMVSGGLKHCTWRLRSYFKSTLSAQVLVSLERVVKCFATWTANRFAGLECHCGSFCNVIWYQSFQITSLSIKGLLHSLDLIARQDQLYLVVFCGWFKCSVVDRGLPENPFWSVLSMLGSMLIFFVGWNMCEIKILNAAANLKSGEILIGLLLSGKSTHDRMFSPKMSAPHLSLF